MGKTKRLAKAPVSLAVREPVAAERTRAVRHEKPAPGPESTVSERIDWCVDRMARNAWHGYESREILVRSLSLSDKTVQTYATEASRRLRDAPERVEELRLVHQAELERVRRRAMREPDLHAAIKAIELHGRFDGSLREQGPSATAAVTVVLTHDQERAVRGTLSVDEDTDDKGTVQ